MPKHKDAKARRDHRLHILAKRDGRAGAKVTRAVYERSWFSNKYMPHDGGGQRKLRGKDGSKHTPDAVAFQKQILGRRAA